MQRVVVVVVLLSWVGIDSGLRAQQTSRDTGAAEPLSLACDELRRLRAAEAGPDTRPAARELRVDAVRELFRRGAAFGLSGGWLVARAGRIVAMEACGLADHEKGVPMRTDAVFDVGSVAKQFTAAAVMALEDDGRLRTTYLISRFFPALPEDKRAITVEHLLTHTAGFAHDVGNPETLPTRDEAVRQILQSALRSPPGAKYAYSNAGYVLLAAIVELASGESFEAFQRRRLWLPLGMTRTGAVLPDWGGALLAQGVMFTGPLPARRPEIWSAGGPSWLVRGCGHVSSTLEDLHRWCEALRTGRVLTADARARMFRPRVRETVKEVSYYGYGWQITSGADGSCLVTHDGSAGIHFDVVAILPGHESVFVGFCTQQATPWKDFPERMFAVLTGTADPGLPAVAESPAGAIADYEGIYRLPSGRSLEVVARNGRLAVPVSHAEILRLFSPWPPADPASTRGLGDRQALVSEVIGGIARGDYGPLGSRLPKDVALADEVAFWKEYWPKWIAGMGPYEGADLVDTALVDGSLRTLALLRFARSSTVVGFVHSPGGKVFVDTMTRRFFRELALAPAGGNEFLTHHPQTGRSTRVVFGGPPAGGTLTVVNGDERTTAHRVASSRPASRQR